MSNILLTGASGYIGKTLLMKLQKFRVISIDRVYNELVSNLSNTFILNDLNTLSSSETEILNDFHGTVIHLAAARTDDANQEVYFKDNVSATEAILNKLNPVNIKLFIHISSVAAIDGEKIEKDKINIYNSDDFYRLTKFHQQKIIEKWGIRYHVPIKILAPSAIYDHNAILNSTNIGRLENVVKKIRVVPRINVLKSLTSMEYIIKVISELLDNQLQNKTRTPKEIIDRYLLIDKPTLTVTQICQKKFNINYVITIPKLQNLLLLLAWIIKLFGLQKKIPLTKQRILKLYKPTDYIIGSSYKEWKNEEA